MHIWQLFDNYLIIIWCLFDHYLIIICCLFDAYWIIIWCLFDNYLTIIWCLFDAYLIIMCCLFATNNDQISINIGSNHKIRIKLSSNNHQIIFNSSMLLTMPRRSDDMRRPRWRCWWRLAETTPLSRIGRPRRRWRGGRGLGQHFTVVGKLRGPEACAARISGWIPRLKVSSVNNGTSSSSMALQGRRRQGPAHANKDAASVRQSQ